MHWARLKLAASIGDAKLLQAPDSEMFQISLLTSRSSADVLLRRPATSM
jgi:hypothetical protein